MKRTRSLVIALTVGASTLALAAGGRPAATTTRSVNAAHSSTKFIHRRQAGTGPQTDDRCSLGQPDRDARRRPAAASFSPAEAVRQPERIAFRFPQRESFGQPECVAESEAHPPAEAESVGFTFGVPERESVRLAFGFPESETHSEAKAQPFGFALGITECQPGAQPESRAERQPIRLAFGQPERDAYR